MHVNGVGEVQGAPDTLTTRIGVQATAEDVTAAIEEANAAVAEVTDAVIAAGVAREDIQTQQVSIDPQYSGALPGGTSTISGYQATNTLQVTVRDQTYRAVGWLQAEWEIAANAGGGFFGAAEGTRTNQAPTLVVDAARTAPLSGTLTMTTTVSDDGLPEPRERGRGGGRGTLPTFERNPDGPTLPINGPQLQSANRSRPTRTRVERVTVTWTQWHGPTGVTLESEGEPQDGVATVTATFTTAGEYVFKVQASDGPQTVTETITVTVR